VSGYSLNRLEQTLLHPLTVKLAQVLKKRSFSEAVPAAAALKVARRLP
jgi:hypothetical protein